MDIISCKINSNNGKNFKIELSRGSGFYVFIRLKVPTRFYINGIYYDANENDIFLYRKGDPQYFYGPSDCSYIDDFIHFDIDSEEDAVLMNQLSLKYNQILHLPNIHSFMKVHQMICTEFISHNNFRKEALDHLMRYFLIKLNEAMNDDYSSYDYSLQKKFYELRLQLYGSPATKWTVKDMADSVNLSPSYFQAVYKKLFCISCMADLFTCRMDHAKYLLTATLLPIKDIAEQCGYESNIYFARHFKKKTGMTPSEYRLQFGRASG